MAQASANMQPGEECTLVLMGRIWRCMVYKVDVRMQSGSYHIETMDGGSFVAPGLTRRRMTVEYEVLEELQADTTLLSAAIATVAQEARDRGERQIDL